MSRRNYKELWEQLKVVICCNSRLRYSRKEVFELIENLEILQLGQDPLKVMLEELSKSKKKEVM